MTDKQLKKSVVKWAQQVGRKNALRRLVFIGLSSSMAERLIKGTYSSEPHPDRVDLIRAEMAKDGFSLTGERAS